MDNYVSNKEIHYVFAFTSFLITKMVFYILVFGSLIMWHTYENVYGTYEMI